jgi:hypothetical protein
MYRLSRTEVRMGKETCTRLMYICVNKIIYYRGKIITFTLYLCVYIKNYVLCTNVHGYDVMQRLGGSGIKAEQESYPGWWPWPAGEEGRQWNLRKAGGPITLKLARTLIYIPQVGDDTLDKSGYVRGPLRLE